MLNKKILIVGDANHQLITNSVIWLNKQYDNIFEIDTLSYTHLSNNNKIHYNLVFELKNNLVLRIVSKIKGIRVSLSLFNVSDFSQKTTEIRYYTLSLCRSKQLSFN